jgi:hypothetical protein
MSENGVPKTVFGYKKDVKLGNEYSIFGLIKDTTGVSGCYLNIGVPVFEQL